MNELVDILKILSDKNRLRILKLLEKKKRMCVCELAFVLGITQPSISRHLKKMKSAGIITDEQDSFWTNYTLDEDLPGKSKALIALTLSWLDSDPIIQQDEQKAGSADRDTLCC